MFSTARRMRVTQDRILEQVVFPLATLVICVAEPNVRFQRKLRPLRRDPQADRDAGLGA